MSTAERIKGFMGVSRQLWRDPRTWLMLLAITEKNIFRYMMLVLNIATGIEGIGDVVMHTAYIVLILLCLRRGSRFRGWDIGIMMFVVIAILLTWIIYPDNIESQMIGKGQLWPTVFPLFRFFIVGLFLIPNEETVKMMGMVSCVAILVESIFVYFILRGTELQSNDDMSRAYFILLNVLLVINYAFDSRNMWAVLFSVVGLLFLASMGTRGPMVITLAFIATKIFQFSMSRGHGFFALIAMLILIWFINSDSWNVFLLFMRDVIESLGLSTRVIDLAIQDETFTYYSERDEIAQVVWSKIKERPLTGWGVYGEWQFTGWSAHNMFLELLCHYGVFLGGAIIIWMLYINVKAFIISKVSTPVRSLVLLLACFALVRGVFGGGFLTFPTFFMIGYCLQVCRKTNFKYLV